MGKKKEVEGLVDDVNDYVVIPPNGEWGWMVVIATFFCNGIADGIITTFGLFIEDIHNDLKVDVATLANTSSLMTGLYFLFGPIACAISNRFGFRLVAFSGGLLATASIVGSSYLHSVPLFILIYGPGLGIGFSCTYIASILSVGFYFDRLRAVATAFAVCGTAVGTIIFPIIYMALKSFNWRKKFLIMAGCTGFITLLGFVYKPITPSKIVIETKTKGVPSTAATTSDDTSSKKSYPTTAALLAKTSFIIQPSHYSEYLPSSSSRTSFKSFRKHSAFSFVSGKFSALTGITQLGQRKKCSRYCCFCCMPKHVHRPMYKDDILFAGSITTLPEYKQAPTRLGKNVDYHMNVTRATTVQDVEEAYQCCLCCPESIQRTLIMMLDVSLLKSFSFDVLLISGLLTYTGLYIPYVFIIDYSKENGIDDRTATFLLTIIGIANFVGRVGSGLMTMIPNMKALLLTAISITIGGAAIGTYGFIKGLLVARIAAFVFGLCIATTATLRTVIAVEMVGLEKLSNSFGLIVLFEGIGALSGMPLAGVIRTYFGFEMVFVFAGATIVMSGLILFPIPYLQKWERRRIEKRIQMEIERRQKERRQRLEKLNKK